MPVGFPSAQQPSLNEQLALGRRLEAERLAGERTREWDAYMSRQPERNTYNCVAELEDLRRRGYGSMAQPFPSDAFERARACLARNDWPLDGPFPQIESMVRVSSAPSPGKDREGFDLPRPSPFGIALATFHAAQTSWYPQVWEVKGPSDYDVRVLSDIDNEAWNRRDVRGEFQRRIDVEDERRRLEATLLAQAQIEQEAQRIVPDSTPALAPPLVDQLREITGGLVPSLNTWAASTGTTLTPQSVLALAPPESLVVVIGGAVGLIVFVGAIYYYRNKPSR